MNSENTQNPPLPVWQYDEMKHSGVDYQDAVIAAAYDERHGAFRDYEADARLIVERLGLGASDTVIDLGCGTGAFVLTAARLCKKIHAVDVSRAMLERLADKAVKARLSNIETHHAGFLTYEHTDAPADAIVSVAALHHLPDFWKAVALQRMRSMLKPEGKLYLFDVVFTFSADEHRFEFDRWVDGMRQKADESMAEETIAHIRDEFSTFDWILKGLLDRAGFRIEHTFHDFPLCMTCICAKNAPD